MLRGHGLDPSPTNYAFAHRYCMGGDAEFIREIDETVARSGGLSAVAAAAIVAERSVNLSAFDLARIASEAQELLGGISERLGVATEAAGDYRDALQTDADGLSTGEDPAAIVERLILLTADMIGRTRAVERDLRQAGDEMRDMRAGLADAQADADRDPLTGMPNRRALDARFAGAIETAQREGTALSIAICDIDRFKAINDGFGHQIGDEVIKFVGTSLGGGDPSRVFAARYGGEEFVVLFERMSMAEAMSEIDRVRAAICAREMRITATGQSLGTVSFSAGVSAYSAGEGAYAVLKRADVALYRAKSGGRNRIEAG